MAYVDQASGMDGDIEGSLILQKKMGLPDHMTRILSKAESKELVSRIKALTPENQAKRIVGLSNHYGEYFDRVYRELVRDGLPASTQVVATVTGNPVLLRDVSQAVDAGEKEIKETIGDNSKVQATRTHVQDALSRYRETVMRESMVLIKVLSDHRGGRDQDAIDVEPGEFQHITGQAESYQEDD